MTLRKHFADDVFESYFVSMETKPQHSHEYNHKEINHSHERFSMVFSGIAIFVYLTNSEKTENTDGVGLTVLALIVLFIISFLFSKSDKKKHQTNKMSAVSKFVKEPDINLEIVDSLIAEIERYNKKTENICNVDCRDISNIYYFILHTNFRLFHQGI